MNKYLNKILNGLIQIHILHHAQKTPIYGSWMISELKRHGYHISPGTLYPLLHKMEKENLLAKRVEIVEGKKRIYYSITRQGENLLKELRGKVKELFHEII
ncbi:PadR family transcriptional regulator [Petrotoga olearia]|uniref:PadR family transcriptional regulator n=2 Tax=Petrotoga olearia TaxID=156203 RepID=A0A2K1NX07_9BACT|nr:PadR family transcriptional regulator [Petrotoga olearia]PNR95072.1 PadR family transcriptional regulator [Petrotoga olearia DSM 13574]RMA72883.1 DNA-binding PadR family transcriptional regulator [Petrotoga olearia]